MKTTGKFSGGFPFSARFSWNFCAPQICAFWSRTSAVTHWVFPFCLFANKVLLILQRKNKRCGHLPDTSTHSHQNNRFLHRPASIPEAGLFSFQGRSITLCKSSYTVYITIIVTSSPTKRKDLEYWTSYNEFISQFSGETLFHAEVNTYLYGGEDIVDATPEEVAYMSMRYAKDQRFLTGHCNHIGHSEFVFNIRII